MRYDVVVSNDWARAEEKLTVAQVEPAGDDLSEDASSPGNATTERNLVCAEMFWQENTNQFVICVKAFRKLYDAISS